MKIHAQIIVLLLAAACTPTPQKPAAVVNKNQEFYGKNAQSAATAKQNEQGAKVLATSPQTGEQSQYYYEQPVSSVETAPVASRELSAPVEQNTAAEKAPEIKLKWQKQETELEKSYRETGNSDTTQASTENAANPLQEELKTEQQPAAKAAKPDNTTPAVAVTQKFAWPARGKFISSFGDMKDGVANDGVNIALPEGSEVKAAADGTVIYSGNGLEGYGNLVIIKHEGGYYTSYGHNGKIIAAKGEKITKGQVIAQSGASGGVKTPQLHFSIRKGKEPQDPLPLLQ